MANAQIILGGVPLVLHAGAPEETIEPLGGSAVLRMSGGAGIKQQHWTKSAGTISGSGWMPPGLDGLDYTLPLELCSTKVQNIVGAGPEFHLDGTPRPDVEPWAQALIGGRDWVKVPCTFADGIVTVPPVPGATMYQASYLPVFSVLTDKPSGSQSSATAAHSWSITWEEA